MDEMTPNATPELPRAEADTAPDPHAEIWKAHADADLAANKIDTATHQQILSELGFNQQAPQPAAKDETAEFLSAEGFTPGKASDFTLPAMVKDNEPFTPELQAADRTMRGWLEESRLTKEIGSYVASEIARAAPAWGRMNDGERELHGQKARAALEKLWGPDKAAERIELARQLVLEIDKARPGLIRFLDESGAGSNVNVIAQIGMQAERLRARDGKQ